LLVQRSMSAAYRPHRFCDPASPLAYAPVLRVSASDTAGWCLCLPDRASQRVLLLLQSVTHGTSSSTAAWSTSRELCYPTAHAVCRIHYGRRFPACRFRLQGLGTLLTVFSSTNLADPVSGPQRSWVSPFEAFSSRRVLRHSCRTDPHAVSAPDRQPTRRAGPTKAPRLLGFAPAASPLWQNRTIRFGLHWRLPWDSPF